MYEFSGRGRDRCEGLGRDALTRSPVAWQTLQNAPSSSAMCVLQCNSNQLGAVALWRMSLWFTSGCLVCHCLICSLLRVPEEPHPDICFIHVLGALRGDQNRKRSLIPSSRETSRQVFARGHRLRRLRSLRLGTISKQVSGLITPSRHGADL